MKIVFVIGCCELGEENVWHVWNVTKMWSVLTQKKNYFVKFVKITSFIIQIAVKTLEGDFKKALRQEWRFFDIEQKRFSSKESFTKVWSERFALTSS